MAEIRPDQYQNGDKQKDLEIKRDVKLYIMKSYVMELFLCNSMFNTMATFTADMDPFLDLRGLGQYKRRGDPGT